jgi:hypothetical protein
MPRLARLALLCVAALAALAASGCGNKHDKVTLAETEGIYVTVDDLKYQIQISRILNPAALDDASYLRGLPEDEAEPADDEVWYGIFMRVENDSDDPHPTAEEFTIVDTQDDEFEPVELDPAVNDFVYEPTELQPGEVLPAPDTAAADNTIRGGLILFKVTTESLANRPMELEIASPSGGEGAVIDIDV